jgi:hypothetical protein
LSMMKWRTRCGRRLWSRLCPWRRQILPRAAVTGSWSGAVVNELWRKIPATLVLFRWGKRVRERRHRKLNRIEENGEAGATGTSWLKVGFELRASSMARRWWKIRLPGGAIFRVSKDG